MIVEPLFIVLLSAAVSSGLILPLRPWLQRYALAQPNARSSHRLPTPQGGGIAVVAATIAASAAAVALSGTQDPAALGILLAGSVLIALAGVFDDIWAIEVAPRLLLQTLAGALMLASLPAELRVAPVLPWWIERALMLLACLWFVNLTNFMDGIDWMTVAEFIPLTAGLALIGLSGALPPESNTVALALCGGLLGFAPFNKPVARLFLGDVGSLPIGLVMSWLLVTLAGRGHLAAALTLPLYYSADATLTLLRRMFRREAVWRAHRTHFYQRATDGGFSVGSIVARVFATNVALAALASATIVWPGAFSSIVALSCGATLVGFLLRSFARGKS